MWILLSVIGYEPTGGVNRLIHTAASSVLLSWLPKPIEFSCVPSSSSKAAGALSDLLGSLPAGLELSLSGPAATLSLVLAGWRPASSLPGLPRPMLIASGGQV